MKSGLTGHWSVKDAEITGAGLTGRSTGPSTFINIKGSGFRGLLSCGSPNGVEQFCNFVVDICEGYLMIVGCPVRVKFDRADNAVAIGHITNDDLWFHFSDVEGTRYVAAD